MAKLVGTNKGSKDNYSLSVDLSEIGDNLSSTVKTQIGQAIIDKILDRTEKGRAVVGSKFKKYSKAYTESAEFERAGKNKNIVDLDLFGDMLNELDIKSTSGNKVELSFGDLLQSNKAFNHDTGDTLPKRQFFNLNTREWNEIKREFKQPAVTRQDELDIATADAISEPSTLNTLESLFPDLFGDDFGEN